MSISLQKGQKIDLKKEDSGFGNNFVALNKLMVGLGWDEAQNTKDGVLSSLLSNNTIDCDASAILCGSNGKVVGQDIKEHCVYFGNLKHKSGAIIHQGDNLTGEGDGDDEQIKVDLRSIPSSIEKIIFVVNIYDAESKKQHFGMIKNAFIRIVDMDNNIEICRFNLSDNYDGMTGLVVGEIYRYRDEWKFSAIGQPVKSASRLSKLIDLYK